MPLPHKTAKLKNALKSAARLGPVRRQSRTTTTTTATTTTTTTASGFGSGSGSSSSDEVSTPNAAAAGPTAPKAKATPSSSKPPVARKPKPNLKRGLRVSRLGVGFGKGSGRNTLFTPIEGEKPWVFLRVQVVGCTDLLAKDRNGFSDPFASISLPPNPTKHTTPVSKRTLNPSFPPAQSTFDFPIYRSLVDRLGVLEVVLWDKDFFGVGLGTSKGGVGVGRKEYLGEVALGLEKWFEANGGRALGWHMRKNNSDGHEGEEGCVFELPLVSTRSNTHARGKVKLRLGFVSGSDSEAERKGNVKETEEEMDFEKVYEELLRSSRPSLVNIPPTEGLGTVRSHRSAPAPPNLDPTSFPDPSSAPATTSDAVDAGTSTTNVNVNAVHTTVAGTSNVDGNANAYLVNPDATDGYQDVYSAYNAYSSYPYEDDGGLSSEDEIDDEEEDAEDANVVPDADGRSYQSESESESEYSEVEVEYDSDSESDVQSELESEGEYSDASDSGQSEVGHSDEEEGSGSDVQTPTLSPTATIVPGPSETSPMTTPTASATGTDATSFSALYDHEHEKHEAGKPSSAGPSPDHTTRSASAPSSPTSPAFTSVPTVLERNTTRTRDRTQPPPALNLTPASPVMVAPVPLLLAPSSSQTPSRQATTEAGAPLPSPSRSRFRLTPTRANTAPYPPSSPPRTVSTSPVLSHAPASASTSVPKSPGLGLGSKIIPRIPLPSIPKPRFPTRRNTSTGVPSLSSSAGVGTSTSMLGPPSSSIAGAVSAMPMVYDLTEDVLPLPSPTRLTMPSSPSDMVSGNTTDPGLSASPTKAKKSRFRKSWSGVRVSSKYKERQREASSSSSASTPSMYASGYVADDMASPALDPTVAGAETQANKKKKLRMKKAKGKAKANVDGVEGEAEAGEITKTTKAKKIKTKKIKVKKIKVPKGKGKAPADPSSLSQPQRQSQKKPTRPRLPNRRTRPSYLLGAPGATANNNSQEGYDGDIVGIVMLEIERAEDLPRLKNMTRTGWDMDPFIVISFGKKVFRTRVIRHSLNPVFDEKLLFHVRRYETGFKVQLTILDWDKLSSNDYIGQVDFGVSELIEAFESGRGGVDPETGLYPLEFDSGSEGAGTTEGSRSVMKEFRLPLKTAKEMPWETKHRPVVTFRAKYQPYAALRQRFWLQYLKQYDTDDTGMLSHLELTSMLDSLGSTLSRGTISSFFTRFGKNADEEELTMAEAIQCLETELGRPERERKTVGEDSYLRGGGGGAGEGDESSVSATPVLMFADKRGKELSLDQLDFSGPPLSAMVNPGMQDEEFEMDRVPAVKGGENGAGVMRPLGLRVGTGVEYNGGADGSGSGNDSFYFSSDAERLNNVNLMEYPASGSGSRSNGEVSSGSASAAGTLPVPLPASASNTITPTNFRSNSITFAPSPISFSHSYSSTTSSGTSASAPGTHFPPSTSAPSVQPDSTSVVERVINVQTCPLCHRPRLSAKAEVDIVTHLAICASQDWNKVDRIMVGNFVTASQAQRKWYTRIIGKMSSGNYKLGANSANIIVQNRLTGQLEEEKMQVYIRLGIRLLYKGMKSRMEGSRARRLLKSLSIKQGVKYDSPESVRDILPFIQFHKLDMNEVRDPVGSFKTFNQFFYRKLKPDARPVESPSDPYRLVSAADCRFMAFESVNEATKLWIKGREFSVARLLGDAYKAEADRYTGGALAIFRLAPQDYHRFHSPVDGRIGKMSYIAGEYYTVNPQAIRTALDVYGENARKIVPIDSPQFGRVMAVCVGAMMVGTILTTVEEGQFVKRGEEFGYFAFGGSTIVLLFERGVLEWDEDLVINSRAALETLVRVGMGIGTGLRKGHARTPTPGH